MDIGEATLIVSRSEPTPVRRDMLRTENECPKHPRAQRCFHRGDYFVAEHIYANGRYHVTFTAPLGEVDVQRPSTPQPSDADLLYETMVDRLRIELTERGA